MHDDITDGGERISPDRRDWGYYAHLSLYEFCASFAQGARALDAGCGTGYGSAHLLQRGAASVLGVDSSPKAVEFANSRYGHAGGPSFRAMDICRSGQLAPDSLDVIFCNIAEHLADVDAFLANSRQALSPRGVLVMAVPAIANAGILEGNMRNPYHITHMPPKSWLTKLGRYFYAVRGFRHWIGPEWVEPNGFPRGTSLPPEETVIRETDFTFTASPADDLNREAYNITLVILACAPRQYVLQPTTDESAFPEDWRVEEIRSRIAAQPAP
jgi:SAM-dependent methyltransferase